MATGKSDGPDFPERPVFAATIRPHRSLGRDGFRIMMVLCAVVAAIVSARFVSMGFWPVSGFFGLDLLGLYVAFRVSYRRGLSFEEVVLTRLELLIRKVSPRGDASEWRSNPLWTRLRRDTHEEFGLQRLALESRGRSIVIAHELSPGEREDFADAFGQALADVKGGRTLG